MILCCRVDLHTQKADKANISVEDRARSSRTREAAQKLFLSPATSVWIIAARLFPFLLPVIRLFAYRYPDKALVGDTLQIISPGTRVNLRHPDCMALLGLIDYLAISFEF